MGSFPPPHGGQLKELYLDASAAAAEKERAKAYKSWDLTERQLCDLELILNGAFSPLDGFLGKADYAGVLEDLRLKSGILWPMPITLDVSKAVADTVKPGESIALRDQEGVLIATLRIAHIWTPDKAKEAKAVFGTDDPSHPGADYLQHTAGPVYIGGQLRGVERPTHYDFNGLRSTPGELRAHFRKLGWHKVVAFQTRNPLHRAHQELTLRAAREAGANLLIHPVVGLTKPGDVDHYTRVRCYEHVLEQYPPQTTALALLNLAMRMAGPREAVWHAIIRKNYGCTHFIVGRDHAGPGNDSKGQPFYGPYDAQVLLRKYEKELAISMVPFQEMVYVEDRAQYVAIDATKEGERVLSISGTEFRRRLSEGLEIPEWFSFPEVVEELRRTYPARHQQGFTVFFTGLSGSGKSAVARALLAMLLENGGRRVTLLDGDLVRKNLSSELGFSREHRDLNILRIGYVASEITRNGGVAICAPIAPYAATRRKVRQTIEAIGGFLEVHLSTPLEVCEQRDRKGLYAKARAGILKEFTGISDPYEVPASPELRIDTQGITPDVVARHILVKLQSMGFIK
ncbi:MAG: bifunctional sulfate adenylyltransferase/adenylylsulfate kinase [Gammaproteobacteria bacterium]